ncbi:MAG: glycine cleavage system protein H [Candidatus Rokubacteria bacterium RIFCSPLOWO2_02_FULL_68_19]|nr:MAG: glycine cleavage system protein H [Candidatus Rokubacteria bacterium RIFCSPLOWO2_02_FULL_68_19]OGL17112.1 MAG: glycine cleavage system protein H [Candidatus Rokubacteria bacterium RIFCSPLOWO2_12_FULL_69_21]
MATIFNCKLPEDLYYLVDKHVWLRPAADGPVTVGISDVARHLAGTIVAVTPKKAGRAVPKGQSVATIESSKWVGPVPAPVSGEIVEVNETVRKNPRLVNEDPYGAGWLVKLRPSAWDAERAGLVTGSAGLEAYRAFLEREGIQCGGTS